MPQAAKRYIPAWPGIEKFQGVIHHSSFWPDEAIDIRGKRCAVIGTGASGVQISQEWGPLAGSLKVLQRTPNLAIPMGKKPLTAEAQEAHKAWYPRLFEMRERCFAGFLYDFAEKRTFDDTPEEREAFYQTLWDSAGFNFWLANYRDYLYDGPANTEAYNFWAKKVRERITDPRKRDILAPLDMPHYFGIKRPCLEQHYYEEFNRENVDVVDVSKNSIKEFDEMGLTLEDGTHFDLDAIAIATGFVSLIWPPGKHPQTLTPLPPGHYHWRHDPDGSQVDQLDGIADRVASSRQHLPRHDGLRISEHVPYVRSTWPGESRHLQYLRARFATKFADNGRRVDSPLKRPRDCRGSGPVDRGCHHQDPQTGNQVRKCHAGGDQDLEAAYQRSEQRNTVPHDEEHVYGWFGARKGV